MIDQKTLKEMLDYSPDTGEFRWKVKSGRSGFGKVAGSVRRVSESYFRVEISVAGKRYKAHRLAWLYVHGTMPDMEIDHINGDPLDNRIANLRLATHQQNQMNRGLQANNTSGHAGVIWDSQHKKWRAQIKKLGKCIYLGLFDDKDDAVRRRAMAVLEHHQEFGRV